MKAVRILVTGSRHIDEAGTVYVWDVLVKTLAQVGSRRDIVFVHGAATGVDESVSRWVSSYTPHLGITAEPHPADWAQGGRIAGPQRNLTMVKLGADLCLAFPRPASKGTWGCLRMAADAGIPVHIYPLPKMIGARS